MTTEHKYRPKAEIVAEANKHKTDVSQPEYKTAMMLKLAVEVLCDIRDILDATGPFIGEINDSLEAVAEAFEDGAHDIAKNVSHLEDRVGEIGGLLEDKLPTPKA